MKANLYKTNFLNFIRIRKAYRVIWDPIIKETYNNINKYMYKQRQASDKYYNDNNFMICLSPEVLFKYDINSFDVDADNIYDEDNEFMKLFNIVKDRISYCISTKKRIKFWIKLSNNKYDFLKKYSYLNGNIEVISWKQCDYGFNTDPDNNWYSEIYNIDNFNKDFSYDEDIDNLLQFIYRLDSNDNTIEKEKVSIYINKNKKCLKAMDEESSKRMLPLLKSPNKLYDRYKDKRPLGDGYTADNGPYYKWFYEANIYTNEDDWLNFVEYINENVYSNFKNSFNRKGFRYAKL